MNNIQDYVLEINIIDENNFKIFNVSFVENELDYIIKKKKKNLSHILSRKYCIY